MTEKDLKKLGFKKKNISVEESGDFPFSYFVLDIGDFCLISNTDMDDLFIEVFNSDQFKFTNLDDLTILIEILKDNVRK
jgi:hypothetical protein